MLHLGEILRAQLVLLLPGFRNSFDGNHDWHRVSRSLWAFSIKEKLPVLMGWCVVCGWTILSCGEFSGWDQIRFYHSLILVLLSGKIWNKYVLLLNESLLNIKNDTFISYLSELWQDFTFIILSQYDWHYISESNDQTLQDVKWAIL